MLLQNTQIVQRTSLRRCKLSKLSQAYNKVYASTLCQHVCENRTYSLLLCNIQTERERERERGCTRSSQYSESKSDRTFGLHVLHPYTFAVLIKTASFYHHREEANLSQACFKEHAHVTTHDRRSWPKDASFFLNALHSASRWPKC